MIPAWLRHAVLLLAASLWAGDDRVWIDREAGVAFRHPAHITPVDPWSPVLIDTQADGVRGWRQRPAEREGLAPWAVRAFSGTVADGTAVPAIAGRILGGSWTSGSDQDGRLQLRSAAGARAVVVLRAGMAHGLAVGQAVVEADGTAMLASFELLEQRDGGPKRSHREAACAAGGIMRADGSVAQRSRTPAAAGWDDALEYESRHHLVRGLARPDELADLGEHLDALHAALRAWLPIAGEPVQKCLVLVAQSPAGFAALLPGMVVPGQDGMLPVEGMYLPGPSGGMAVTFAGKMGRSIGTLRLRAGHEVVHQYIHRFARRHVPRWFDEGCAVLFENGMRQGSEYVIPVQEVRLRVIEGHYRQRRAMLAPLAEHLDGRIGIDGRMYGEAYAMLRVLATPGPPAAVPALTAAWRVMLVPPDPEAAGDPFTDALIADRPGPRETAMAGWERQVVRWVVSGDRRERLRIPIATGR